MTARRWALLAITLCVVLAHLWLTDELASHLATPTEKPDDDMARMKAVYVSEMKLSEPPVAAISATPPSARPAPRAKNQPQPAITAEKPASPPEAASQPTDIASSPLDAASGVKDLDNPSLAELPASAPPIPIAAASAPTSDVSAAVPPALPSASLPNAATSTSAGAGPKFVWPLATKVSYKMEGNYRGPIYGQASVEWVRQDDEYQVHLDASVGPSFAPLGSWRLSSEGKITANGLRPSKYENSNKLLIRTSPTRSVKFLDEDVVLQDGQKAPRVAGLQDPVSQLIHLGYKLITHPELLKPGNTIEMPIALLRKVEVFAYDVVGQETLNTPMGRIPTWHLKPRRLETTKDTISMEIWFAPGLQYLPVRLFVRQDEQTFMDLTLVKPPQFAPGEGIQPGAISASQP